MRKFSKLPFPARLAFLPPPPLTPLWSWLRPWPPPADSFYYASSPWSSYTCEDPSWTIGAYPSAPPLPPKKRCCVPTAGTPTSQLSSHMKKNNTSSLPAVPYYSIHTPSYSPMPFHDHLSVLRGTDRRQSVDHSMGTAASDNCVGNDGMRRCWAMVPQEQGYIGFQRCLNPAAPVAPAASVFLFLLYWQQKKKQSARMQRHLLKKQYDDDNDCNSSHSTSRPAQTERRRRGNTESTAPPPWMAACPQGCILLHAVSPVNYSIRGRCSAAS